MIERLTLTPSTWYGMTMWPGYLNTVYHSPILIRAVIPIRGKHRRVNVEFHNLGYADGARDMIYDLRVLKRDAGYILASIEATNRSIAIVPLSEEWLQTHLSADAHRWAEQEMRLLKGLHR